MGSDRLEEVGAGGSAGADSLVPRGAGAPGVGEGVSGTTPEDRGGGGMAEQAVNWDEVIRELEAGDLTPAQVAEKYGFGRQRAFSRMLKAAPEEIRPRLRQAKLRGEKRRIREGKTNPSRRRSQSKTETEYVEPSEPEQTQTQQEAERKAEEIARTVVKKEEKEEEQKESRFSRTWVWLLVAGVGAVLLYMALRNRERMQRAQRFIDRALRENPEERRPPESPRRFWDEYRL